MLAECISKVVVLMRKKWQTRKEFEIEKSASIHRRKVTGCKESD